MTRAAPRLRWIRRCWPQKVRTRLTLLYAVLFFAAGSALLGLTYALVASSLPAQPAANPKAGQEQAKLLQQCDQERARAPTVPKPQLPACQQLKAFSAGASSGSQALRQRALNELLVFSLVGLGAMTVISAGLGWVVSGRVLRPVRVITETARRASEQHLGERLALTGPRDELKELADTFDSMLERLDQAFTAQRRFVANASHELRTPLTVMRTAIDVTLAKPHPTEQQLKDMAARVRRSIDRAEAMIGALLTLAAADQGHDSSEFIDLATSAEDAIDAAAAGIERLGLRVDTELEPAETTGDQLLLEQMIGNLVDNAVLHNNAGGWVRVEAGSSDGHARFTIANSGPMVPEALLPSLFEPFRRATERTGTGDGAGLGLAIVRSIGTAHAADVAARSVPAGGLLVTVTLPSVPADEDLGPY